LEGVGGWKTRFMRKPLFVISKFQQNQRIFLLF